MKKSIEKERVDIQKNLISWFLLKQRAENNITHVGNKSNCVLCRCEIYAPRIFCKKCIELIEV